MSEAKTLRKEIARIAADYDIEWKGELENLAKDPPLEEKLGQEEDDHTKKSDKSHRDSPSEGEGSPTRTGAGTGTGAGNLKTTSNEGINGKTKTKAERGKGEGGAGGSGGKKLDIDKTIDEASELAEQTDVQRNKERAAQRKGEVVDDRDDRGIRKEERQESEKAGVERGMEKVGENRKKYE